MNYFVIAAGVLLLALVIYLFIKKDWEKLRRIALALMLQAERVMADEEGQAKMEAVFETVYNFLMPVWLRPFVTEEYVRDLLQQWYDKAKELLENPR